MWLGLVIDCV